MTDPHSRAVVQTILRTAALQVEAMDPDLAADLSDLANDYAGPYTEQETTK